MALTLNLVGFNTLRYKIMSWWGKELNVLPRLSKPKTNAWWYINNEWVYVPKDTPFHWGKHVDKHSPDLEDLTRALENDTSKVLSKV